MQESLLITDLRCAEPGEAWTDADSTLFKDVSARTGTRWRILDYEGEGFSGGMLCTLDDDAPPLTIPLNRSGWHAVSILVACLGGAQCGIEVRLSGDERWQLVHAPPHKDAAPWKERGMWGSPLRWEPWTFADLTRKALEIRKPRNLGRFADRECRTGATIWGVRAVPMPAGHVEIARSRDHRQLVCVNDGHGIFYHAPRPGLHIVREALEPFSASDWDTCCFCHGHLGYPNYPTDAVDRSRSRGWMFARPGDERYCDNVDAMCGRGEDALRCAIDTAHASGHAFWLYIRPQCWAMPVFFDHAFRSGFFGDHPQLRCAEADGTPISKLSIAYPQVREHLARFVQDAIDRDADGLCLALTRGYPLVRYEGPVLERFRQQHGTDARELPDTDERLQATWAQFVTEWVRELRAMLDAAGPSYARKRRELTVFCPAADRCRLFGFDVGAWAQRGLVDVVMPPCRPEGEVEAFAALTRGTPARLVPDIFHGHDGFIADARRIADQCYRHGADGLACWDTDVHLARAGLDNPQTQRLWNEDYMQDLEAGPLKSLCGQAIEPFHPGIGG